MGRQTYTSVRERMPSKPIQKQFDAFIAIVTHGSVESAANRLALTQPAVSRRLADLERCLGARLMERNRAGITLMPLGEAFLRYASASASALAQGVAHIARNRDHNSLSTAMIA